MDGQRRSHKGFEVGDPIAFKADAEKGILTGHSSVFWSVDSYGECTAPGCFQQTIAERGPQGSNRILTRYEHDVTIGAKLVLKEDRTGLYEESKVSDDGMDGTRVRRHLADGVVYGLSIGFRRVGYRTATDTDPLVLDHAPKWVQAWFAEDPANILVLTEVKLYETSVVSFPAVDNALVEGYRSAQRTRVVQRLLTDLKAGRLSDDETAALKDLTEAWLADGRSPERGDPDRTPAPTRTVMRRNHAAEFAFARIARELGIETGVAA